MPFTFYIDTPTGERKIKKKTKKEAEEYRKRAIKKGYGVSKINRTFR